jgi:phage baseplate assembly protein W
MAQKEVTGKDVNISKDFRDIDMSFLKNPFTNDINIVKNQNAIKQALKNIMMTKTTEKVFEPDFGTNIWASLFEPMDDITADRIQQEILNVVGQYETRIVIQEVQVVPYYRDNCYHIFISYRIIGNPMTESVSFVLERP